MVHEVRREEGLEWPRLLDLLVEFSEEVVDCWRSGLERCSDTGRRWSMLAAWKEDDEDSAAGFLDLCWRGDVVLRL